MKMLPFYQLPLPNAEPPLRKSARLPYHDDDACPVGQEIKRSGHWAYYEPTQMADTRVRCPLCIELSHPPQARILLCC